MALRTTAGVLTGRGEVQGGRGAGHVRTQGEVEGGGQKPGDAGTGAGRRRKGFPRSRWRKLGPADTLILDFCLQNWGGISFCCSSLFVCVALLQQPQEARAPSPRARATPSPPKVLPDPLLSGLCLCPYASQAGAPRGAPQLLLPAPPPSVSVQARTPLPCRSPSEL